MKSIILASLFMATNAFATVSYSKQRINCSRDILTKQYDQNGNFEKDLITKGDISTSVRETWTEKAGVENRLSQFTILFDGKEAMNGKNLTTVRTTQAPDGSFIEHSDYRGLNIYIEPFTGVNGGQIEEDHSAGDSSYRLNGNVKTYFEPAKDNSPEVVQYAVTRTEKSPTFAVEEAVYPPSERVGNDGKRYVTEHNIMTCTYEKLP